MGPYRAIQHAFYPQKVLMVIMFLFLTAASKIPASSLTQMNQENILHELPALFMFWLWCTDSCSAVLTLSSHRFEAFKHTCSLNQFEQSTQMELNPCILQQLLDTGQDKMFLTSLFSPGSVSLCKHVNTMCTLLICTYTSHSGTGQRVYLTCQTPITALAMRIRRMTRGSTKAVVVSSPSSNRANTYMDIQDTWH